VKVLVAVAHPQYAVSPGGGAAITHLLLYAQRTGLDVTLGYVRRYPQAWGRNIALQDARRVGAEAVLFLEDDLLPPADLLTRLLALGSPLASGLYFQAQPPYAPLALRRLSRAERRQLLRQHPHLAPPADQELYASILPLPTTPFPAEVTGIGALLLRREVWEQSPELLFEHHPRPAGTTYEDLHFTRALGPQFGPVQVDPGAVCPRTTFRAITLADHIPPGTRSTVDLRPEWEWYPSILEGPA
jgi:hypothetical protein